MAQSVSAMPGIRVLVRLGATRAVRFTAIVFWIGILVWVPVALRPDLIRPADIGSDTSNYVAAAERLLDGHSIYSLAPGDRPVPEDNLPEWRGPLLSPPTVATTWALIDWLPDPALFHLTWALGLAAATALGLYLVMRLRPWVVLAVLLALYPLGVVAWSGNLNAPLAAGIAGIWILSQRERSTITDVGMGVIAGLATALKLGPVLLTWWFVTQRRWKAAIASLVVVAALAAGTLALGGPAAFTDYIGLLRSDGAAPSPLSLPGLASRLGLDPLWGYVGIAVLVALVGSAMVWQRARPGRTFALAVLLSLMVVTIVRVETLVVGVAALMPWATRSAVQAAPRSRLGMAVLGAGACVAAVGVIASIATGGLASTSMALRNDTDAPLVVRFTVPGQYATFGYRLAPGGQGVAWANEFGAEQGRLVVFTDDCRLLYDVVVDHPTVGWAIGSVSASEMSTPTASSPMPFDPTCARELRARREAPR